MFSDVRPSISNSVPHQKHSISLHSDSCKKRSNFIGRVLGRFGAGLAQDGSLWRHAFAPRKPVAVLSGEAACGRFPAKCRRFSRASAREPSCTSPAPNCPGLSPCATPDSSNPGKNSYTDNTLLEKFLKSKIL